MLLVAAAVKACALLTAADVASVQGEKPAKVRESRPRHADSQCFFALRNASKSVTLEVSRGPRATQFADRLRVAAEVEGEEAAAEHDEPAVEAVPGVGDEAWWAGPGGLYVRRGETLLRIVAGGEESKEAKLGKLRLLATKALARLSR